MSDRNNDDADLLLQKLTKAFYKGSLNIFLQLEDVKLMTWDWQEKFLNATVNSFLIKKYPTSRQFTRLFLRKVIEHLEGNQEIHDDFYSHLCVAMSSGINEDSFCYRHYIINDQKNVITIKETNKMVVNGTTGMRTWEAALMLADWALLNKETFANKTILELGSGVGFTGITVGKLCQPKCIYLSDCHPEVMKAICENIEINFPKSEIIESNDVTLFKNGSGAIGAIPLDWNSLEDIPNDVVPDILIGADIVYDPSILQPLCEVLKTFFIKNNQMDVYIASVIRNEETFQAFSKQLDNMGFSYQKLTINECAYIEWDHRIEKCLMKINYCF